MVTDRAAHLLLASAYGVEEPLELPRPFHVDVLLPDAGVQAPRELVAGVDGDDVLHLEVVQRHQELRAQRAVVDVPRAQEERPEELQRHVVQLDVGADHLGEAAHDLGLPPPLGRHPEEAGGDGGGGRRRRREGGGRPAERGLPLGAVSARVQDLLLLLDVLTEEGRDLVAEEGLVVSPQVALDGDVAVGVELLVPDEHAQKAVLDEVHVLEDGHDDGAQLFYLDDGEGLDEQLLELALSLLGVPRRVRAHGGHLCNQPLSQILEHRVVKVEPLDAVQVEQGQHGAQRRQKDSVLNLEVLDGLQGICTRCEGLTQKVTPGDTDLLETEPGASPTG